MKGLDTLAAFGRVDVLGAEEAKGGAATAGLGGYFTVHISTFTD